MIEQDKWVWLLLMIALVVIAVQEWSYRSSIEQVSKEYMDNCAPIHTKEVNTVYKETLVRQEFVNSSEVKV